MRLLRSKKLRGALLLSTGGKCSACGAQLERGWHADHVVPWSLTHRTNVHEMQPLCPSCNLKKGARTSSRGTMKLRKHQQQFRDAVGDIDEAKLPATILMHVTPGGGKSLIPKIAHARFSKYKVAWFVPRRSLRRQAAIGSMPELKLMEIEGFEIDPSKGCQGFVATHAALAAQPELFRQEISRHPYIVIIDEAHHGKLERRSEEGKPIAAAFRRIADVARLRVDLSGTLETNDGAQIWCLEYQEDCGVLRPRTDVSHNVFIRYTRQDALRDGAVVPVVFHHYDGDVAWQQGDDEQQTRLSEAARADQGKSLWTALRSQIADDMLRDGVAHWREHSNGKLIVLADRQESARRYAKQLAEAGLDPALAIDDNEKADHDLARFLDNATGPSRTRVMVTCQMAYEGLDVPSATHLICLTHIRSTPWIEQALGRVWRATKGKRQCHAFVPDDPKMREVVERIRAEQEAVIPAMLESEQNGSAVGGSDDFDPIIPLHGSTEHVYETTLDGGVAVADSDVLTQYLESLDMMTASERRRLMEKLREMDEEARRQPLLTAADERKALRDRLSALARAKASDLARRTKMQPNWEIPFLWLKRQTGRAVADMNVDQLKDAYRRLEGWNANYDAR